VALINLGLDCGCDFDKKVERQRRRSGCPRAFHLWVGQAEGESRGPRALATGPQVALPTLFEGGESVLTVRGALAALDPATLLAFDGMLFIQDSYRFYQLGEAYGWWHGPTVLPPPVLQASKAKSEAKDGAQDKKLTPGEIELIQSSGHDIHEIKEENGGRPPSRFDLYKDPDGNIDVRPKNSGKRGEPTGLNINDFKG